MSVIGYKVLGMNMESLNGNGMIYNMNVDYTMDDNIRCGFIGYHCYLSMVGVLIQYSESNNRVFECVLDGDKFDSIGNNVCSNHIRLVKELSKDDIEQYISSNWESLIYDENPRIRHITAKRGFGLYKLVHDKDVYVRLEVARQGYGLDVLVYDEEWEVRAIVARHGYRLDILVNDVNAYVRSEVAKHGYGLYILINDRRPYVREEVARQGYGLDILINDTDWYVRKEVARQGYGLDILVNDECEEIRNIAMNGAVYKTDLRKVRYQRTLRFIRRLINMIKRRKQNENRI